MKTMAIKNDIWYYIPTVKQSARGMFVIKSDSLFFAYSSTEDAKKSNTLCDININIQSGEFVAILGRNGSGKSTLAKHLNALLIPTSGSLWVKGLDTKKRANTWEVRQSTGMVFQNPDNQIVATLVEDDVAFGPENLGVPPPEIAERVTTNLEIVNMSNSSKTAPHLLSGGQKQRVAIAGILAMKPNCIVFDEATAMLDPSGRKEILQTARKLNKDEGITIILITHLMEEALESNRVIVMNNGKIVMDGHPKSIFVDNKKLMSLGLALPRITELCDKLRARGMDLQSNVASELDFIKEVGIQKILSANKNRAVEIPRRSNQTENHKIKIEVNNLCHTYNMGSVFEKKALSDISFKIEEGEIAAIIGHTGSGKSTLIQHLNALLAPTSGTIRIDGENIHENKAKLKSFRQKVGIVFQYPEHQLFESTILKDVSFGPKQMKVDSHLVEEHARDALLAVGISEDIFCKSPFELSGGQKRRVAIAGVLAMRPNILILDEPTAGLDPSGKKEILGHIKYLHDSLGLTIILVSHSMDDVAEYANKIFVMNDGKIKFAGTPKEVFGMDKALRNIGLDVPRISSLFIKLNEINSAIPKSVINLREAVDILVSMSEDVN